MKQERRNKRHYSEYQSSHHTLLRIRLSPSSVPVEDTRAQRDVHGCLQENILTGSVGFH